MSEIEIYENAWKKIRRVASEAHNDQIIEIMDSTEFYMAEEKEKQVMQAKTHIDGILEKAQEERKRILEIIRRKRETV